MLRTTWQGLAPTSDEAVASFVEDMPKGPDAILDGAQSCRRRCARLWLRCLGCIGLLAATSCVTVRPEQRAVLADPTMQYESNRLEEAARQHVIENREGSYGGGSIQGGGCGCN